MVDTADWHASLCFLYEYWRSVSPPGSLPGRQHFDPAAVVKLLPRLWLLDVQREPFRLRYRLAGTRIVEAIGREVTGQWLDEAHPHVGADPASLERYRQVVASGVPSRRKGRATLFHHNDYKTIENAIFPFAADGENVDLLMICTIFYRGDGGPDLAG